VSAEPVTSDGLLDAGAPPEVEGELHPADDARSYAEWVAIWQEEQAAQERQEVAEQENAPELSSPPTMEELGLNPRSLDDCEAYSWYLIDHPLEVQDIADQVVLDAIERAEQIADSGEAARVVAEGHRAADEYVARHVPWLRSRPRLAPLHRRAPRPRERRTQPRPRRVRIRSGSRGDPPPGSQDDDDPHDARRAQRPAGARPAYVAADRPEAA
jgi:hypothetical protein